jgi:hypothetical protein
MALQLATGISGGLAQMPGMRSSAAASSTPKPTAGYQRDIGALRTAGQRSVQIASVDAGKLGIASALTDLAKAQSGVSEISDILDQMKALTNLATQKTVASATGIETSDSDILLAQGLSTTDRAHLQNGFDNLRAEITAIVARTTNDAGTVLLDGDGGASRTLTYTVGGSGDGGETLSVSIAAATVAKLATGLDSADLLTSANATTGDTLTSDAQDAATALATALKAQQNHASGAGSLVAGYGAAAGAEKNENLELKGVVDISSEVAAMTTRNIGSNAIGQNYQKALGLLGGLSSPVSQTRSDTSAGIGGNDSGSSSSSAPSSAPSSPPPSSSGGGVDISA